MMSIDWERLTETCDFWVGVFPDEDAYSEYVGADPRYYELRHTEEKVPLSLFIKDQGLDRYEEVIEMGFKANAGSIAELVKGHSYADQYADELARRVNAIGLSGINGFLFISAGEIPEPHTVKTASFTVWYVGQITYRI
jgi:hypothetical protein